MNNTEQIIQTLNKLKEIMTELENQLKQTVIPEHLKGADNYTFLNACEVGNLNNVKIMLTMPNINPAYEKNHPIQIASMYGLSKIVKLLLQDERVDPSDDNNRAIKIAVESGNKKVVKLLLKDDRVDPTVNNNYLLKRANEKGWTAIVTLLLNHPKVKAKLGL